MVTSDLIDGGPTLWIPVQAQRGRSADSCFRQKLFSREQMDDDIFCQGSIRLYFTHMTCVRCSWFWFDKAEHFHVHCVQWTTKPVRILPSPNEASVTRSGEAPTCRNSQASCSQLCQNFFGFVERRNVGINPGLPEEGFCLYRRVSNEKIILHSAVCNVSST